MKAISTRRKKKSRSNSSRPEENQKWLKDEFLKLIKQKLIDELQIITRVKRWGRRSRRNYTSMRTTIKFKNWNTPTTSYTNTSKTWGVKEYFFVKNLCNTPTHRNHTHQPDQHHSNSKSFLFKLSPYYSGVWQRKEETFNPFFPL